MAFDEAAYVQDFIKKQRRASVLPDDLLVRYAITLPATDSEIAAQLKAVRAYWNKTYLGKSTAAQVASMCRAEDERLRAEHGPAMERRAWWEKQQAARQSAAEASIVRLADELRQGYAQLGVVTSGIVEKFAARLELSGPQATQAVERAGLRLVTGLSLPESEPIGAFTALLKSMSECGVISVPELVHPGSGPFKLVERYVCLADPAKRLDAVAVEAQSTEAEKRGVNATENARRNALKILRKAVKDGVDLRDLALYHLIAMAREAAQLSASLAVDELHKTGLDRTDAAIIAVVLREQSSPAGPVGVSEVQNLLKTGRLREAGQAAQALPDGSGQRVEALALVTEAKTRLDALLAQVAAAARIPDEAQAAKLLRDATQISLEDADEALAAIPLPPPAGLRAVCDGAAVKLFWRLAAGHDGDTEYVACRTEQRPPAAATDGVTIFRGQRDTCADSRAPVARELQYGVFALAAGRPGSRAATVPVTLLPPVTRLEADVGPATIALHWSAHPDAHAIRVTRTAAGGSPVQVPVTGNGCLVQGLTEGQDQHFEVTALYRGRDGRELAAAAEQINATPRSEARPIRKLRTEPFEAGGAVRVRISWAPVDKSEVRIVRSDTPPALALGTWVSRQQMAEAGQEVTGHVGAVHGEIALDAELPPGVHYLVPFSIGGTGIVAGRPATVAVTDPVRHLQVTPFATYATVSWEWPPSAQLAEVAWEIDGNEDCFLISRAEYRSAGGARVPLGGGNCTVEVRAVIMVGDASFTAPPARTVIDQVVDTAVSYTVSAGLGVGPFGGRSKKVTFRSEAACEDVRIRIIASPGRVMPTEAAAGVRLLETSLTLQPGVAVEHHVTVPRVVKRPYWVRCFVVGGRAKLVDPPISSLKET
ncbi:MAG TPA: hypothetical protein VFQ68_02590 [Streptosporangiaceae bacterium]|nr:hypothetical protein [Streptosporangiaceae bacterium]